MDIRVECTAGHGGEPTPRRFWLGDRLVEVTEIVDSWLSPDHSTFKVRGSDGATYVLRRGRDPAAWTLEFYAVGGRKPVSS